MKRRYRIATIICSILSLLCVGAELLKENFELQTATNIIGGADGQTTIYIAEKTSSGSIFIIAAIVCVGAAAALFLLSRKKTN